MWTELIKNFGDIFLKPKTCTVICWNCCWKLLQLFWITRDLRCQKHLGILGFLQRQSKSEDMALSSGPLRKQKVTSTGSKGHGLWFVIGRFQSVLCVCCFWISEFLKSAVSFPALCLVDQGDLYFDVLLCDVNFSCFSSRVFLPSYWSLDSQGEIIPIEETQSGNESVHFCQHLILQLLPVISPLFDKQDLVAMVAVWLTLKKSPKSWNIFDNAGRMWSETLFKASHLYANSHSGVCVVKDGKKLWINY